MSAMANPSLREFQRWMKSRVRPQGLAASEEGADLLNSQRGTPGAERLSVYAGGYVARTREALAEVYEAIQHLIGDGAFSELAVAYAAVHPSHEYNLSLMGRHLPEFLATAPISQQFPFLPDLSRLEWAVCEAFHAVDRLPIAPARMAALSLEEWNRTRLLFQPSVHLIASAWPVADLWEARTRPVAEIAIELVNRPQRALICRKGLQVVCDLVDERQEVLLAGLMAGKTLGEMCAALADRVHDEPLPLSEWFARWVRRGLIVDYR